MSIDSDSVSIGGDSAADASFDVAQDIPLSQGIPPSQDGPPSEDGPPHIWSSEAPSFAAPDQFSSVPRNTSFSGSKRVPRLALMRRKLSSPDTSFAHAQLKKCSSKVISLGEVAAEESRDGGESQVGSYCGSSPGRFCGPGSPRRLGGFGVIDANSGRGNTSPRIASDSPNHRGRTHHSTLYASQRKGLLDLSKALPAAEQAVLTLQKLIRQLGEEGMGMVQPRNTIEAAVRIEMAKVLGVEESMICCSTSDFFSLGGSIEGAERFLFALRKRPELLGPDGQGPQIAMEEFKAKATVSRLATAIAVRGISLHGILDGQGFRSSQSRNGSKQRIASKHRYMTKTKSDSAPGYPATAAGPACRNMDSGGAHSASDSTAPKRPPATSAPSARLLDSRPGSRQNSKTQPGPCLIESPPEELPPAPQHLPTINSDSNTNSHAVGPVLSHKPPIVEIREISREEMQCRRLSASGRFRVDDDADDARGRRNRISTRQRIADVLFGPMNPASKLNGFSLLAVVESGLFNVVSGAFIFASSVCIGIETEFRAVGQNTEPFGAINVAFDVVFLCELLMRMGAYGKKFYSNADKKWNCLDIFCLVASAAGDVVGMLDFQLAQMQILKGLRMLRLIRTLRLLRTLKSVREFQKMLYALMSSFRTLLCSLMILFVVMYFFGIVLCQGVTLYKSGEPELEVARQLEKYFGSMTNTFVCLLMSITGGFSWTEAFDPLSQISPVYGILFLAYITTCLFGVMNVVTSVFVESAIMSAQHYKHLIIQEKAREREIAMGHMKQVFEQIDEDGSGEITADEMDEFLQDAGLRKYIEALDINAENARVLFRLLDRDGSDQVDIDEFCEGCLRLQGDAKSFDVHALMFQMKTFLTKWSDFTIFVEGCFADLAEAQGRPDLFAQEFELPVLSMFTQSTSRSKHEGLATA